MITQADFEIAAHQIGGEQIREIAYNGEVWSQVRFSDVPLISVYSDEADVQTIEILQVAIEIARQIAVDGPNWRPPPNL